MPFQFPLQAVLRFRESIERRERLRLAAITRELIKMWKQKEQAERDRASTAIHWQGRVRQGVTASEMHFEQACDRSRARRISACTQQVSKLEDLRRRQVEVFCKAQQQRKILENLRVRQLTSYLIVQARRQQQELDERFLLTRAWQSTDVQESTHRQS